MNTLSVTIFFLLLPVLIIGFLSILEMKRGKQVKRALEKAIGQLVTENNLGMLEIDFFLRKAIGIDRKNVKLVFVNFRDESTDKFCIDLETLFFCRVVKTWDESTEKIKKIFLEIRSKNSNEASKLVFYDRTSDNRYAKASLIRRAEYWKSKINFYRASGELTIFKDENGQTLEQLKKY